MIIKREKIHITYIGNETGDINLEPADIKRVIKGELLQTKLKSPAPLLVARSTAADASGLSSADRSCLCVSPHNELPNCTLQSCLLCFSVSETLLSRENIIQHLHLPAPTPEASTLSVAIGALPSPFKGVGAGRCPLPRPVQPGPPSTLVGPPDPQPL